MGAAASPPVPPCSTTTATASAGLGPWRVLGKTGTAQVGSPGARNAPAPHAWFVGFAPEEAPSLAVCVFVEHGGGGGEAAAPIAEQVFRAWALLREPVG